MSLSDALKLKDYEIADILYHVTFDTYLSSIKENGLLPKSKKKYTQNPPRIYLINLRESDLTNWKGGLVKDVPKKWSRQYIDILTRQLKYFEQSRANAVIFQIPKSNLKGYTFYKDPEYEYGIYVTEPIPYNLLEDFNPELLKESKY